MGSELLLLSALLLGQVAEPLPPDEDAATEARAGATEAAAAAPAVIGIGTRSGFGPLVPGPLRSQPPADLTGELTERLDQLAAAQGEDGLWGSDPSDLRPSAWALLALQGAGHTHKSGLYKATVKTGLLAFVQRERANEHGGIASAGAPLAERALTTHAMLMAYTGTLDYAMERATGLAYGDLLESVTEGPASEADGRAWSTLALIRALGLAPRWPEDVAPSRRWDEAAVDALLVARLAAWEQEWQTATIPGQPWDAARLAEHLPWLLTAQLVSTVQSLNDLDGRFLDAHPELASSDFSGADAETLCWLVWVAGECGPDRFPGWRERLDTALTPRLEALVRDGDTRELALATLAWVSLQQP